MSAKADADMNLSWRAAARIKMRKEGTDPKEAAAAAGTSLQELEAEAAAMLKEDAKHGRNVQAPLPGHVLHGTLVPTGTSEKGGKRWKPAVGAAPSKAQIQVYATIKAKGGPMTISDLADALANAGNIPKDNQRYYRAWNQCDQLKKKGYAVMEGKPQKVRLIKELPK